MSRSYVGQIFEGALTEKDYKVDYFLALVFFGFGIASLFTEFTRMDLVFYFGLSFLFCILAYFQPFRRLFARLQKP